MDLFLNGSATGKGIINSQVHDLNKDVAFVKKKIGVGAENYAIDSGDKNNIVKNGFYNYCKGKKFSEEYAYVPKTSEQTIDEDITKIVIRYKEQS